MRRRFGIALHEIEIAPDVAELLPRIVDVLDEPVGDPAAINTLLICEAARAAGVKVMLSGMGADELFGGYRKHLACVYAARYQRLPQPVRRGIVRPIVDRLPVAVGDRGLRPARWAKRFLTFADLPEESAFRRSYTLYDPEVLRRAHRPELAPYVAEVMEEHRHVYEDTTLPDHVNRMCLADARLFLPGLNLAYTDRASMAASTEVRVPFVDVEVVRAAFSLPGRAKVRTGRARLRSSAPPSRGFRGRSCTARRRRSARRFAAWIARDLRELVDDVLVGGELVRSGSCTGARVQLIDEERTGREDRAKQIWQLLSLELWYQRARHLGVV